MSPLQVPMQGFFGDFGSHKVCSLTQNATFAGPIATGAYTPISHLPQGIWSGGRGCERDVFSLIHALTSVRSPSIRGIIKRSL